MENTIITLTLWAAISTACFLVTLILLIVSRSNNKTLLNKIIQQHDKIQDYAQIALNINQDIFPNPDIKLVSSDYTGNTKRLNQAV